MLTKVFEVREKVQERITTVDYISTKDTIVDSLNKVIPNTGFLKYVISMRVLLSFEDALD